MSAFQFHLAPLQSLSCWALRALCQGATDSYTEMIELKPLLQSLDYNAEWLDTYEVPNQRQWVQVLTNSVEFMEKLPQKLLNFGKRFPDRAHIFGININAGCPSPAVIASGEGAALIKRITRIKKMIRAFLGPADSHPFHISIKTRLGLNAHEMVSNQVLNVLNAIKDIDDKRLDATIIHFKHAQQTSYEPERWELLDTILSAKMPIILNGGIESPDSLTQIQQKPPNKRHMAAWGTQIRGIMIGRAALRDYSIFESFSKIKWGGYEGKQGINLSSKSQEISSQRKKLLPFLQMHSPESRYIRALSAYFDVDI